MSENTISTTVLPEFSDLYTDEYRYLVYYSGRSCLAMGTPVVMADGTTKAVEMLATGDKVISYDECSDEYVENTVADVAVAGQRPKPMIEWTYEGETQTVTYDHPYLCGQGFYPLYQLIWRSLDESQRRQLALLCKQYGAPLDFKLERVKHSCCNSTCERCQRLPANRPRWADNQGAQDYCTDIFSEASDDGHREPPERRQERQPSAEPRMVHETIQQCLSRRGTTEAKGDAEVPTGRDRSHSQLLRQTHCSLAKNGQAENHSLRHFVQDAPTSAEGLLARIMHSSFKVSPWRLYYGVELARAPFTYVIGRRHHFVTHNTGKSFAVAMNQLIRAMSKQTKFLDVREVQSSIKDSVKSLLESLITANGWQEYFEIYRDSIKCRINGSEWVFLGLKDDPTKVQSYDGIDEVWVEEAQSISHRSLMALLPTIRKPGSRLIFTMNRLTDADPVYQYFTETPPPRTMVKYLDPLTLDRYGLQPQEMIDLREAEKGSPDYAFVWLGEPLSQVDNAILSRDEVLKAFDRTGDYTGAWQVGVDVARFGQDRTVFVARKGLCTMGIQVHRHKSLTEQTALLKEFVSSMQEPRIKIDETGVGGGLVDMCKAEGLNVEPVNFAQGAKEPDKYPNAASEMWFDFQKLLPDVGLDKVYEFRTELLSELSQRSWTFDAKGRRVVEQKSAFKAQGNRSPDIADALLLCYYEPKQKKQIEWW